MARANKRNNRNGKGKPSNQNNFRKRSDIAKVDASAIVPSPKAVSQYAAEVADPFNAPSNGGVPMFPVVPTQKVTSRRSGVMSTSATTGVGYIMANRSAVPSTTAQEANVVYSTSAFLGTTMSQSPGTGKIAIAANSGVTAAEVTAKTIELRTVAAGLRIRYIGPQQDMAGYVTVAHSPFDKTLDGLETADLEEWESTATLPVTRQWTTVAWTPVNVRDTEFVGSADYTDQQVASYGIMIAGINSGAFQWEHIIHFEKSGAGARGASINEVHTEHAQAVISEIKKHDHGTLSKLANSTFAGKALRYGERLAQQALMKYGPGLANRALGFAKRAAPLALTL